MFRYLRRLQHPLNYSDLRDRAAVLKSEEKLDIIDRAEVGPEDVPEERGQEGGKHGTYLIIFISRYYLFIFLMSGAVQPVQHADSQQREVSAGARAEDARGVDR